MLYLPGQTGTRLGSEEQLATMVHVIMIEFQERASRVYSRIDCGAVESQKRLNFSAKFVAHYKD